MSTSIFPQYVYQPQLVTPTPNAQAQFGLGEKPSDNANANFFPTSQGLAFVPPAVGVDSQSPVGSQGFTPAMFGALPTKLNNKAGFEGIEDYKKLAGFSMASGSKLNLRA